LYTTDPKIIALTAITEEFFLFKKSFDRAVDPDFFSEPEPRYSNINNGLGIFAGYNTIYVEVDF